MTQEQFNFICDLYDEGDVDMTYDNCIIYPLRNKELFESYYDNWPPKGKHFNHVNFNNLSVTKLVPVDLSSMYSSTIEGGVSPKWAAGFVSCDLCNYEWVAVRRSDCLKLECPMCENITTFTTPEDNE